MGLVRPSLSKWRRKGTTASCLWKRRPRFARIPTPSEPFRSRWERHCGLRQSRRDRERTTGRDSDRRSAFQREPGKPALCGQQWPCPSESSFKAAERLGYENNLSRSCRTGISRPGLQSALGNPIRSCPASFPGNLASANRRSHGRSADRQMDPVAILDLAKSAFCSTLKNARILNAIPNAKEILIARKVFGERISYERVPITDGIGAEGRPFTVPIHNSIVGKGLDNARCTRWTKQVVRDSSLPWA